jgi:lycopene cyclase domain-containing protein
MWLYALLLLGSILIPMILSFEKKLQFYKKWKLIIPSITIVAFIYILFDVWLTRLGVWGFNPRYHSTLIIGGLPVEEWAFFFVIPYASLFIHFSFFVYFPKIHLKPRTGKLLTFLLILLSLSVLVLNFNRIYTIYIFSFLILVLLLSYLDRARVIDKLYISFLIILIPFFIVNGVLTGSIIEQEVVWYNPEHNLGLRILTIPIEDFAYAFSMFLTNVLLMEMFRKRSSISNGYSD